MNRHFKSIDLLLEMDLVVHCNSSSKYLIFLRVECNTLDPAPVPLYRPPLPGGATVSSGNFELNIGGAVWAKTHGNPSK